MRSWKVVIVAAALTALGACKTAPDDSAQGTAGDPAATTGSTGGAADGTGTSIPTLVNVNLENVLNNLSVALDIEEANIPVNAQVPIDVAANVCGVSVSALSASIASGQASCTATTVSPQLTQVVQQQISAGGDVGGGDQTTNFI
jgi:hypothetical protein